MIIDMMKGGKVMSAYGTIAGDKEGLTSKARPSTDIMDVLGDTASIDNGVDSRNGKRVTLSHDKEVGPSEGGTESSESRDGHEEKVEQHFGRFVLVVVTER